jgi:hypothetical protein
VGDALSVFDLEPVLIDPLSYNLVRVSLVTPPKHELEGATFLSDLMSHRFAWVKVATPWTLMAK